ncbi:helix-turn-helix transcriptional regulator [Streptomyces morookaense]|uniref:helix-turn-helix domain-containing protein n=1 Tax=Streptomyces morookaense TaxID=1970 RepID=UPI0033D400D5
MARRGRELTPDRSPRHAFGAELRRHRERAGMSLEQLAQVVRYSRSHLGRIEIAEHMPPPGLAEKLDTVFETDGIFKLLYGLALRASHPDKYERLREIEAKARSVRQYAGCFVPGLLQTPDYARTVRRLNDPRRTEEMVEEWVAVRMSRQAVLRADPAPEFSYVMDEAVLRRPIGRPETWRAQLSALISNVDTPTTMLQVLPFAHGGHGLIGGHLTLFTLGDGTVVACEESITAIELLEDQERVSRHSRRYDLLRSYALSPSDSAAFIETVLKEFSS